MPINEVVDRIITLNDDLKQFWTSVDGWAPIEAVQRLSKSRLDWQVSLSAYLETLSAKPLPDDEIYKPREICFRNQL